MPTATTEQPTATSIRPLGDRILVQAIAREEMTSSGLYLPDTTQERPQEARVLAVGPGKLLDTGQRVAIDLKPGDRVLFAKYSGTEIKQGGEDYLVLRESDVLAIIKD
jgi:chaperonin GroES